MFIIVLNSTNIVDNGQNNTLDYKFPNSIQLKDKYIAVCSISMYYSWFNITKSYNNNYFSYTWTSGTTTTTYTINIPDGLYQLADINKLIQFECISNKTYWIIGGINYYPFEFLIDPVQYSVNINTYLIPTSTPSGATTPSGFVGWPSTVRNSVITIPSNFNIIVGYPAGFATNSNIGNPPGVPATTQYVKKDQASGTISYISPFAPQIQPNNNVLFNLSNVNNPYSQPSGIIYSLNPNVEVGRQISEKPPNFLWTKMIDGTYNNIRLNLLNNKLEPLILKDANMTILLAIRDKNDVGNT